MEFIKQGMLLAGAVFVFTVSFIKDLLDCSPVQNKFLVAMSWGAMAVSLLGGLGHLAGWDRFYIRYRDDFHALNEFDSTLSLTLDATTKETLRRITQQKIDKIKQLRTRITLARRTAMAAQLLGFAVGIITIAIFYYQNLR
ncbi:hypothetical protein BHS09_25390 [Myxococcus xanthus]|uniref:Uncharacterized protein n=2 Tax=Myxococcus xanthus TaxID=34 RepID=A0AAE6KU54_MYXXA|nr:hypothetical protein BHS09_25390 [Myxococcus xanthus]QDE77321.1 hypothetical protein BHS08_25415 [Myxococcus xanthus]